MKTSAFQKYILHWYQKNKRDFLPWRHSQTCQPRSTRRHSQTCQPDSYHILVSEIMLQQTQVSRVLQKYPEFLEAFPTIQSLAEGELQDILRVWQGMGYNRRALYLQNIARDIVKRYNGVIPREVQELKTLKGVGEYTAGAVACFAFNEPVAFLDTNIRKVFIWNFFHGREKVSDREILAVAEKALWRKNPREWHYALMDYGALALKSERSILVKAKAYHKQLPFTGSTRQARSKIVRHLVAYKESPEEELRTLVKEKFDAAIASLLKDNLVRKNVFGHYMVSS